MRKINIAFVNLLIPLFLLVRKSTQICHGKVCQAIKDPPEWRTEGYSLNGYTFKNITLTEITCSEYCLMDCRCVSFNQREDTNECEFNYENNNTAPGSLKPRTGYSYQEVQITTEKRKSCSSVCDEICCIPSPCENNGKCSDVCDHEIYRFNCSCSLGYKGRLCGQRMNCSDGPCLNGGNCTDLPQGYNCACANGLVGEHCEIFNVSNCREIYERGLSNKSGPYTILVNGTQNTVFCQIEDHNSCGSGGWTLVMKLDGWKGTFSYHSQFWLNKETYNPEAAKHGLDQQESKTSAYWDTQFNKLCLGMNSFGTSKWLTVNFTAISLYDVIHNEQFRELPVNRTSWLGLVSGSALQKNCGKSGLNNYYRYHKVRIGIIGNNEKGCSSCDSSLGFGLHPGDFSCGNLATYNVRRYLRAFGYILVQ